MVKHFLSLTALGLILFHVSPARGATAAGPSMLPDGDGVRYVGAVGCQSSMCHGGASPSRDQFTIWSHEDFHSRAYATLVTARSVRIAATLGLASAAENARCTVCHAPFADVPVDHRASESIVTDGVSCESCHNDASGWLRGHTRYDWTYRDRVNAGMRNLRSAYVRADTCVACHQVIDPALVQAGHPELTFELDGQTASEPRHWTEKADWFGPKAWLVGQAVALREISRQISTGGIDDGDLVNQQNALVWLLGKVPGTGSPFAGKIGTGGMAPWSNEVAQTVSGREWSPEMSRQALAALAATSDSFITDDATPLPERELRAERLVLGLDRLFKSVHPEPIAAGVPELSALFAAVQDRARFDPREFAALLRKFSAAVASGK